MLVTRVTQVSTSLCHTADLEILDRIGFRQINPIWFGQKVSCLFFTLQTNLLPQNFCFSLFLLNSAQRD